MVRLFDATFVLRTFLAARTLVIAPPTCTMAPPDRSDQMSNPALDVLREGARSLARDRDLETTLLGMLRPLADRLGITSAAAFVVTGPGPTLEIAASIGLGDPAALAAAVGNPAHPVTRTVAERAAAFDVRPTAPGGPALRSHLPLIGGDADAGVVIGVLALAHDRPIDAETQLVLGAVADLTAVAIARDRVGNAPTSRNWRTAASETHRIASQPAHAGPRRSPGHRGA